MSNTVHATSPIVPDYRVVTCPHCDKTVEDPQKHCIHCGGLLGENLIYQDEEERSCPFNVDIKDKFYSQGQTGVVEFAYQSLIPLDGTQKVEVGLESSGFRETLKDKPIVDRGSNSLRFEFVPEAAGELLIRLRAIHWDDGGDVNVYEAEDTIWVNEAKAKDSHNNINISLGDISGNYGLDMSGAINVNVDNSKEQAASPPELFKENTFRPLAFYWSYESTKIMQDSLLNGYSGFVQPRAGQKNITRAWLRAQLPSGEHRIACIKTGNTLSIGRDSMCDVVCHLMTSDNHLDPRCNSVSSRHCELSVEGNTCFLRDNSSNGTFVNQKLCQHVREAVGDGDVLNLAGVMPMRLREFRDFTKLQDEIRNKAFRTNISKLSFAKSSFMTEGLPKLPLNCLRLRRLGTGRKRFENFVLLKELDIGSGGTSALVINHPSVARAHGKVVLGKEGVYWVNYSSTHHTSVNGVELDKHESHPLRSGDKIKLGEVVLEFEAESS